MYLVESIFKIIIDLLTTLLQKLNCDYEQPKKCCDALDLLLENDIFWAQVGAILHFKTFETTTNILKFEHSFCLYTLLILTSYE